MGICVKHVKVTDGDTTVALAPWRRH